MRWCRCRHHHHRYGLRRLLSLVATTTQFPSSVLNLCIVYFIVLFKFNLCYNFNSDCLYNWFELSKFYFHKNLIPDISVSDLGAPVCAPGEQSAYTCVSPPKEQNGTNCTNYLYSVWVALNMVMVAGDKNYTSVEIAFCTRLALALFAEFQEDRQSKTDGYAMHGKKQASYYLTREQFQIRIIAGTD